jgi:hypothetical protein
MGSSQGLFLNRVARGERRVRASAGVTPVEVLEAQKRKRLELEAKKSGLQISGLEKESGLPPATCIANFLTSIKTFRRITTHNRYEYILNLFADQVAPKPELSDRLSVTEEPSQLAISPCPLQEHRNSRRAQSHRMALASLSRQRYALVTRWNRCSNRSILPWPPIPCDNSEIP